MSPPRSRRATWLLVTSALVTVGLVATATVVSLRSGDDQSSAARVTGALGFGERALGEVAPSFTIPALTGDGQVRLADHRGRVTVVNFWRSDCTPCRVAYRIYGRLDRDLIREGLHAARLRRPTRNA